MSSFDLAGNAGTEPDLAIIDPADEHFDQSFADCEDYDRVVSDNQASLQHLIDPNDEQIGRYGNPWSLESFDFDSFRDHT